MNVSEEKVILYVDLLLKFNLSDTEADFPFKMSVSF